MIGLLNWLKNRKSSIDYVKEYYPIFLLIALPLIFYYPIFLGYSLFPAEAVLRNHSPWKELPIGENNLPWISKNYHGGDPVFAHYPWKLLGVEMMKNGQWPLWNSYSLAGEPLLANSQSALFYPTNILYWFMDFPVAWSVNNILQTIFGGVFFYLFIRSYKVSKFSSLWGSFIFAWNGFMAYFFHIQVVGQAMIWLPVILLALRKINERWQGQWYLILIFSLSSMFLAGFLQFAFYSLLAAFLFVVVICRKSFAHFLSALLISLTLTSIQLLPTLEYLTKSFRNATEFYDNDFLLSGWEFVKFLMPRFFGHPVFGNWWGFKLEFDRGESSYIGILGLLFAFIGARFALKNKESRFFIYLLVLFILLAYRSPLSNFIYSLQIPFISSVAPARGLGMITLPLAFLSALGVEVILKNQKILIKDLLLGLGLFLMVALLVFSITLGNFGGEKAITETIKQSLVFFITFSTISAFIFISIWKKLLPLTVGLVVIFSFQTVDLIRENKVFTRIFSQLSNIYPDTPLTDYLSGLKSHDRFLSFDLFTLTANTFVPYKLSTYTSYDAIHLKNSEDFARQLFFREPQTYTYDPRAIRYSYLDQDVLNLLNIRYLLSSASLKTPGYELLNKIGGVHIYENKGVYPRGYLISSYEVKREQEKASTIENFGIELRNKVYLRDKLDVELLGSRGEVELLEKQDGYYRWKVTTNTPQLLFISEEFDDGWKGFVDEVSSKIYKANFAFMGIMVSEGQHIIELRYKPDSFEWGKIISFVTISMGFVVLVVSKFFRTRRKSS